MLINFAVTNWMSFRNEARMSMVASREKQHKEYLSVVPTHDLKVLPVAAIYGANASGKSNFCEAIRFLQSLVVKPRKVGQRIPVRPFRLDKESATAPAIFVIELATDDAIYELTVVVDSTRIIEEKLVKVLKTTERAVYWRTNSTEVEFHPTVAKDDRLQSAFSFTRPNELFLQKSVELNCQEFRPVYDWFAHKLVVIGPDSRSALLGTLWQQAAFDSEDVGRLLSAADTGVHRLKLGDIEDTSVPPRLRERIEADLAEGEVTLCEVIGAPHERLFISQTDGEIQYHKLLSVRRSQGGDSVEFEWNEESDGTKRLLDLAPAFLRQSSEEQGESIFVIDELDRSLHTLLARYLVELFLSACHVDNRRQMILTTHDVMLMDQRLLRRDQMWVTERNDSGQSDLYSFSEFEEVRYDKDVRKSYLMGRMGGIPRILAAACNPAEATKGGSR